MKNDQGTEIEMTPVESSNIAARGYDADNQHLYIEFKGSGTYRYKEFSPNDWQAFASAAGDDNQSTGSYFHNNIKNAFPCEKV